MIRQSKPDPFAGASGCFAFLMLAQLQELHFRIFRIPCLLGLVLSSVALVTETRAAEPDVGASVQTRFLRFAIGSDAHVKEFVDRRTGQNYADEPSRPFAWVKRSGQLLPATSICAIDGQWRVTFGDSGVELVLLPRVQDRYLVLEVVSASGDGLEQLIFLDVRLTLQGSPAEPFAACALALNLRTRVQQIPQATSRLRAICYRQFGFTGAAVALVACPPSEMRAVLQRAVMDAPDLPHSPLGGPWALDAPINRGSYLFNFDGITEASVDEWIELARSLGMTQIDFHGGRSFRFGDCRPDPSRYPRLVSPNTKSPSATTYC